MKQDKNSYETETEQTGNSERAKHKPSQLPVAFAYFFTLLISLVAFGAVGFYIIDKFVLTEDEEESTVVVSDAPTEKDRMSILYLQVNGSDEMKNGLVVRFLPDEGKICIVPVSPYTYCSENGDTVGNIYSMSGVSAAKKALEKTYGTEIDKYMTVTDNAFDGIVDYVGGIAHTPTENMFYSDSATGEEISCIKGEKISLSHQLLRLFMNYPSFSGGKGENLKVTSELMKNFINDAFLQIEMLENNMDTLFNMIYNSSDTNMSRNEYISSKKGIIYIMKNYTHPCEAITPVGNWSGDVFYISENFPDDLKNFFET